MGCELNENDSFAINPGLGMAAEIGLPIYKKIWIFMNH